MLTRAIIVSLDSANLEHPICPSWHEHIPIFSSACLQLGGFLINQVRIFMTLRIQGCYSFPVLATRVVDVLVVGSFPSTSSNTKAVDSRTHGAVGCGREVQLLSGGWRFTAWKRAPGRSRRSHGWARGPRVGRGRTGFVLDAPGVLRTGLPS